LLRRVLDVVAVDKLTGAGRPLQLSKHGIIGQQIPNESAVLQHPQPANELLFPEKRIIALMIIKNANRFIIIPPVK
jgi:hypothetical protein